MNFSELRIRGLSSWTMAIFGALAFIFGLVGLIQPELTLQALNLPMIERSARPESDFTLAFLTASSMASFNMGVYYLLASLTNWKAFYRWTVPFRIVTFSVFMLAVMRGIAPSGFIGVAVWELVGALATGAALLYEGRQANTA
jgi:hypothetical protein